MSALALLTLLSWPVQAASGDETLSSLGAKDYAEAARLARARAEKGDADAQNRMGILYANGQGVARDPDEAARWYALAAEEGYDISRSNIDWLRRKGLLTRSVEKPVIDIRQAATGHAGAQYLKGLSLDGDPASQLQWMEKAAKGGSPKAWVFLGRVSEAKSDLKRANDCYRKAAFMGNGEGRTDLGRLYRDGVGVFQDDAAAANWFQFAVAIGDAGGQFALAQMYESGKGFGRPRPELALDYYEKAASQGYPHAAEKAAALKRRIFLRRALKPALIAGAVALLILWIGRKASSPAAARVAALPAPGAPPAAGSLPGRTFWRLLDVFDDSDRRIFVVGKNRQLFREILGLAAGLLAGAVFLAASAAAGRGIAFDLLGFFGSFAVLFGVAMALQPKRRLTLSTGAGMVLLVVETLRWGPREVVYEVREASGTRLALIEADPLDFLTRRDWRMLTPDFSVAGLAHQLEIGEWSLRLPATGEEIAKLGLDGGRTFQRAGDSYRQLILELGPGASALEPRLLLALAMTLRMRMS